MGAGKPLAARHAAKTAWTAAVCVGVMNAGLLWMFGTRVAMLFTKDEAIVKVYVDYIVRSGSLLPVGPH